MPQLALIDDNNNKIYIKKKDIINIRKEEGDKG